MGGSLSKMSMAGLALMCMGAQAGTPQGATIQGNYKEVRSLDVYTAACHANGEVGLMGEEATLAWHVTEGSHNGVDLDGLKVVMVVRASGSLIDDAKDVYPAKSVAIVDEKATPEQHEALVDFAKSMAGRLVEDIVRVEVAPIEMSVHIPEHGYAQLTAGDIVSIETRCLHVDDKQCGNDTAYYSPLTPVKNAAPAYTELDRFAGKGLGVTWSDSDRRSAFLGSFSR